MKCPPCNGTGIQPGYSTKACEVCKGAGLLPDDRLKNPPCVFCRGSGIQRGYSTRVCEVCGGWGRLPQSFSAPAGVEVLLRYVPCGVDRLRGSRAVFKMVDGLVAELD